jgi:hypothetical protein
VQHSRPHQIVVQNLQRRNGIVRTRPSYRTTLLTLGGLIVPERPYRGSRTSTIIRSNLCASRVESRSGCRIWRVSAPAWVYVALTPSSSSMTRNQVRPDFGNEIMASPPCPAAVLASLKTSFTNEPQQMRDRRLDANHQTETSWPDLISLALFINRRDRFSSAARVQVLYESFTRCRLSPPPSEDYVSAQ